MPEAGFGTGIVGSMEGLAGDGAILNRPHDSDCSEGIEPIGILDDLPLQRQRIGTLTMSKREVIDDVNHVVDHLLRNLPLSEDSPRKFTAAFDTVVEFRVAHVVQESGQFDYERIAAHCRS